MVRRKRRRLLLKKGGLCLPEKEFEKRKTDQPAKQITLECIFCDTPLYFNEQHGFYKCPDCGGEWWPGPADPEYGITTLWRDEQRYKRSISKPGGGSRTKGRKRQNNIKKKLITERYELE